MTRKARKLKQCPKSRQALLARSAAHTAMNLIEQIQYEHKLALDHVRHLTRITRSEAEAVMAALDGLEHVDAYYAAKIADILPVHPDDVRAIFARERFSVGSDEIEAIIAAVQENTEA